MAGLNNCDPPLTVLQALQQEKAKLLRKMFSGVQEVDQPLLGRTAYRTMDEMQQLLALLDRYIAAEQGPAAATSVRRAFYPWPPY